MKAVCPPGNESRARTRQIAIVDGRARRKLLVAERLSQLSRRCQMLLAGLDNDEDDPTLVFAGIPYEGAVQLALRDPDVRRAVGMLPAEFPWGAP